MNISYYNGYFYAFDEKGNILDFRYKYTNDRKVYYLCNKQYTEGQLLDMYNDYIDFKEEYAYTIYLNDDDFFAHYSTRLWIVRDISGNEYYNIKDKYCTYEKGRCLISGSLAECIDEFIFADMLKDIKLGKYVY